MNTATQKGTHEQPVLLVSNLEIPTSQIGLQWDEIRCFLAVAELGSFRKAAEATSLSVNVLRKRINDFEHRLDCILFNRSNTGVELTHDGRAVYTVAVEINERVGTIHQLAARRGGRNKDLVRLAVTEGLGTFWIMPQISDLTRQHPKLKIDLRCEMKIPDISRLECDVAIQLERPRDPKLIVKKIASLHLLPFATREYLKEFGHPKTMGDITQHALVHLAAEQIPSLDVAEQAEYDPTLQSVRIITNTSSAQVMGIAEGAGIGILPSYTSALSYNLVPIDVGLYLKRDVYLTYHPDAISFRRVRTVVDWLTRAFNARKYPWFRNNFVPPQKFQKELEQVTMFRNQIGWVSPETE